MRQGTWLTCSGTALIACTYGLARFGFGLFVPQFRTHLGLTSAAAGLVATGGFGSYCLAALVARRLVAAGRLRSAVLLAGGSAALGCAVVAASSDIVLLSVGILVAGSGAGVASPALVALVSRDVPEQRGARAQTVVNSGTGFGVAFAGPAALLLGDRWRLAWLGFAVLAALAVVAVLGSARRATPRSGTREEPVALGRLRPAILAAVLLGVGSAAVWTFGRDLVVTAGHLGPVASAAFWTVLGAAGISGALAGDAVRRYAIAGTWNVLALVLAAATAGLALTPGNVVPASLCAALFGGCYVGLSGILIAWGSELAPAAPGAANAVLFFALAAGQAIGALLLGILLSRFGAVATFSVAAAVIALSCRPAFSPRARPAVSSGLCSDVA